MARLPSSTVPLLEAWRVEKVQPLASVKPVRADTFSTLPVPSLSRTTVPVLIVCKRREGHRAAGQGLELGLRPGSCWRPRSRLARLASVSVLPVPVASSVVVPPLPV